MSDPGLLTRPVGGQVTVGEYFKRIGFSDTVSYDLATLAGLQRCHLASVPFTNLEVYEQRPVGVDDDYCLDQVVEQGRGGWCFVVNGAFALLLQALGFDVRRLGAAVLLDGPSVVIDHECLELTVAEGSYLVDVGFGDRGPTVPIPLNGRHRIDDGIATFELIDSSQGRTLTRAASDDEAPAALYRFRRVSLAQSDFAAASDALWSDPASGFRQQRYSSMLRSHATGWWWETTFDDEIKVVRAGGVERFSPLRPDEAAPSR